MISFWPYGCLETKPLFEHVVAYQHSFVKQRIDRCSDDHRIFLGQSLLQGLYRHFILAKFKHSIHQTGVCVFCVCAQIPENISPISKQDAPSAKTLGGDKPDFQAFIFSPSIEGFRWRVFSIKPLKLTWP